jgi:acyl-CoA synthetase (AMP-forming)/AMP-acid ligase II
MPLERLLEEAALRHPDREALVAGGRRWTYAALDREAEALASSLARSGLRRGDRVCLHAGNAAETVAAMFAAAKAGAAFASVSPEVRPDRLAFILGDCGAKAIVARRSSLLSAGPWLARCPDLRFAVAVDDAPASPPAASEAGRQSAGPQTFLARGMEAACSAPAASYSPGSNSAASAASYSPVPASAEAAGPQLLRYLDLAADPAPVRRPNPCIDPDLAALIYTSGTTGTPKGVALTHANLLFAADSITAYLGLRGDDVILSCLPLSFSYGLTQVITAFRAGATLVLENGFYFPLEILARIEAERATGLPMVPTMATLLLGFEGAARHDLSSVRYLTNAAQALPPGHVPRLRRLFPRASLVSMYGLTECIRVSWMPPERLEEKPDSVGVPIPGTEAWLEDESGARLDRPGEVGELVVRGPHVMAGYWNRPEETALRLKPGPMPGERVLRTGDLFRRDHEGFLYFHSRREDLIKTAGERVGPREIENVLHELEAVAEAAVVGVPDPLLGQAVKAVVVLRPGATLTAQEALRHCRRRLERHKVPRVIEFRSELPKTASGKISRIALAGTP